MKGAIGKRKQKELRQLQLRFLAIPRVARCAENAGWDKADVSRWAQGKVESIPLSRVRDTVLPEWEAFFREFLANEP